jgi:glutamyl-Q tRNA(Asp) synthetase
LLTATASFLDARAHSGRWLLRIEDLDAARVVAGGADKMLRVLQRFGFEWDGELSYQSRRTDGYESALAQLRNQGDTYWCTCSRRDLEGTDHYPGTCRNQFDMPSRPAAIRVRTTHAPISFIDRIQGPQQQDVAADIGDFIVRRRDGIAAYALAVVVDDARQGVTHVVRGADLLGQTGAQNWLQSRLAFNHPRYAHVPVLTEPDGGKLAKSKRSAAIDTPNPGDVLINLFKYLGLQPPIDLNHEHVDSCWRWGIQAWACAAVPPRLSLPAPI